MINFIIVDDIEFFRESICEVILDFSFKINIDINKHVFEDYNKDFRKIVRLNLENKVYILDIETQKHNGIEEAKKIRKKDKDSIIIFLTDYEDTYYPSLLRADMKFIFISKKESFKNLLNKHFNILVNNILQSKESLSFIDHKELINVKFEDLLYIYSKNKKNIIKTKTREIPTSKTLLFFLDILPNYFIKSHKSCVINLHNVIYIGKKIIFCNGCDINLLSRTYKEDVINAYKKELNFI